MAQRQPLERTETSFSHVNQEAYAQAVLNGEGIPKPLWKLVNWMKMKLSWVWPNIRGRWGFKTGERSTKNTVVTKK